MKKPRSLSLHALARFLSKKPIDETYQFSDIKGCLFFQFLKAQGYPVYSVGGDYWTEMDLKGYRGTRVDFPPHFRHVTGPAIASNNFTFGFALATVKRLLKEAKS